MTGLEKDIIIYDEHERDNCIIIYQNTKISKKRRILRVSQNQVTTKTYIYVTSSFSTGKPEIDFLTLRDHNNILSHSNSTSHSIQIHILIQLHIQFSILC